MRLPVWERWLAAAGPWKGWSVCPALLAPEADHISLRHAPQPLAQPIANRLTETLPTGGWLVILDLEPCLGVAVAALLNQWRLANALLILPRWPYPRSMLPTDSLLDGLIRAAPDLAPEAALPNVACVLDAGRAGQMQRRPARDHRADNRYQLLVSELPDLASLRARGVRRLIKLSSR